MVREVQILIDRQHTREPHRPGGERVGPFRGSADGLPELRVPLRGSRRPHDPKQEARVKQSQSMGGGMGVNYFPENRLRRNTWIMPPKKQSQFARTPSCETKPISAEPAKPQTLCSNTVIENPAQERPWKTKPISAAREGCGAESATGDRHTRQIAGVDAQVFALFSPRWRLDYWVCTNINTFVVRESTENEK